MGKYERYILILLAISVALLGIGSIGFDLSTHKEIKKIQKEQQEHEQMIKAIGKRVGEPMWLPEDGDCLNGDCKEEK